MRIIKSQLLFIFLISLIFLNRAQAKVGETVLIVDTLIGYDNNFAIAKYALFEYTPLEGERKYNISLSKYSFPNLIVSNITTKNLALLLDNKGGYFLIENLAGDTIRINKWIVLDNKICDTTIKTVAYLKKINDSLILPPYKVTNKIESSEDVCPEQEKQISFLLNKRRIDLKLSLTANKEIITFHGYKRKKVYEKFLNYNKEDKKFRYKYFHGENRKIIWLYNAYIDFEQCQ